MSVSNNWGALLSSRKPSTLLFIHLRIYVLDFVDNALGEMTIKRKI